MHFERVTSFPCGGGGGSTSLLSG